MKVFEVPEMEVVRFESSDIVASSPCIKDCVCVDCPSCPPGSDDCIYYDFCPEWQYDPNCIGNW